MKNVIVFSLGFVLGLCLGAPAYDQLSTQDITVSQAAEYINYELYHDETPINIIRAVQETEKELENIAREANEGHILDEN